MSVAIQTLEPLAADSYGSQPSAVSLPIKVMNQEDEPFGSDSEVAGRPYEPESDVKKAWEPLSLDEPTEVEPFPLEVLPPVLGSLVVEAANSIGCPPDFIAVPSLVAAGGVIGRSVVLRLREGQDATSTLWAAIIANPSEGKTPALSVARKPIDSIERGLAKEYDEAKEVWKKQCDDASQNGKKAPEKPKLERITIDDITFEYLITCLSSNPRGLVMVHDELATFLSGMNQYRGGRGNDRSVACKIWSSSSIIRDRLSNDDREPIRCEHPSLSLVGALTPNTLREMIHTRGQGGDSDGFTERFLFSFPDRRPLPIWSEDGIDSRLAAKWIKTLERLWKRKPAGKGEETRPLITRMSPGGKVSWRIEFNKHNAEMSDPSFPPQLLGAWGKFREYAARLSLVLALLRQAEDDEADQLDVPEVSEEDVENAWKLITYFKSHARRVHAMASLGAATPEAMAFEAITGWIRENHLECFTVRDVKQARRWIKIDALTRALDRLVKANAIRRQESPSKVKRTGRPRLPSYEVNPALHQSLETS